MAKKGECPTRAAWVWPFFRGSMGVIRPVWRDLFSPEISATAEVARELCRLGDALYWRYKLVAILTKNYTTVAKVKWGPTRAEGRSSCIKFKRSRRRDAPRTVKWWSWWNKWFWRGWIWTDGVELACLHWTEWEDWFRSTGTSQRKWRATCQSTHLIPWSTWTLLRHARHQLKYSSPSDAEEWGFWECELSWSRMFSQLKFQFIFWQSCQCWSNWFCIYRYNHYPLQ